MEFRRKNLSVLALTLLGSALYWSWVIVYLLIAPINLDSIDNARELSGKLRLEPGFTRGLGAWNRLFIDEFEVACTPVGYNRCGVEKQFSAFTGHLISGRYIKYQPRPFQAVNLVVELNSGNHTILAAEAQLAQFQSFNESSKGTNHLTLAIAAVAYVATIIMLFRKTFFPEDQGKSMRGG